MARSWRSSPERRNPPSASWRICRCSFPVRCGRRAKKVPDGCGGSIYPVFNMVADTIQSYLAEYMGLVSADIGFNHNNLE